MIRKYDIHAWWDHPGTPGPDDVDLGEGWVRSFEHAVCLDPQSVAAYLKQHPDAEGALISTLEIRKGGEVLVDKHVAERTIMGWIVSPDRQEGEVIDEPRD